jgi:hypothetical protein
MKREFASEFHSRMRLRNALLIVLLCAIAFTVLPPLDAVTHGPYASWYNDRCQRLADESGLVGRPESDIITVLGRATFSYQYLDPDGLVTTYNYAPCALLPTAKFQVHSVKRIVVAVEQFDD